MPRALVLLRWLAAVAPAVVAPAAVANPGAPLHTPQPVVNCGPPAPPCVTCASAPACAPAPVCATAPPKVVVHVPPPEVVFERGCGGSVFQPRFGLFRKNCGSCGHCDHCGREQAQPQAQMQTVLTPLSATMTSFGSLAHFGGLNLGAANLSTGGMGATNVAAGGMQLVAVPAAASAGRAQFVNMAAERDPCPSPRGDDAFAGLRAVHEAEVRAATLVAARAQHDAELRSTMAALDRARVNMNAALSGSAPDAVTARGAVAAAQASAAVTASVVDHLDRIDLRMRTLEGQIRDMREMQLKLAERVTGQAPKQ